MPLGDKTGPKGEGPETGRVLGYAVSDNPGYSDKKDRPYDGRGGGTGNGQFGRKDVTKDPNLERKITEKGSKIPDATGPHGKGLGPGEGKADGSGLEKSITDFEKSFSLESKNYGVVSKEYSSIYSQNENKYSNATALRNRILSLHNEAVKKGYKGEKRRAYVKEKMKSSTKNSTTKSSNTKK